MSSNSMSSRIELERKSLERAEIVNLNLDGCNATEIEGLTDEFKSLQSLSLSNAGLTTLNGFPSLPLLVKLNLSNNEISDGLDNLCGCAGLIYLNLSGNKIQNLKDVSPIHKLTNLTSLVLENNPLTSTEDYRNKVFELLPQLRYLDGLDKSGNEEKLTDAVANGLTKDHTDINHTNGADAESEDEGSDADETEDVGLSALQGSKDLEDDEEEDDYVPGDEEDLDEDDEDEEDVDEDETANLSGAGVTGPRRATKRCTTEEPEVDRDAKCKNTNETGDHIENEAE